MAQAYARGYPTRVHRLGGIKYMQNLRDLHVFCAVISIKLSAEFN
ncbi:hypothetical protein FRC0485_00447 [Corynebacterium diphtheriae]|nr:hypothetical protein FRC0485_00447 [Corynebacterium diphtheriae]